MAAPILATKLHVPPRRARTVQRPRLYARLSEGPNRKLTLLSAPAGFGKTTLVAEWLAARPSPVAWLSLDEEHADPVRFLAYLVAALRTVDPAIGRDMAGALRSPLPPPADTVLVSLLNDLDGGDELTLVLDDYHSVDETPSEHAVAFLVEHLPPNVHLVLATRTDPRFPLARLRGRGELSELRAADLRFSASEVAAFLNDAIGLGLSAEDLAVLEARSEGWITGLQLAAIALEGSDDASRRIASFGGGHRFVLDYLVEEVLQRQPEHVQRFLVRTSILDRMCGALCDAVLQDPDTPGRETLAYLERANLFVVPLDDARSWYRYHHLFAELLRQRRQQAGPPAEELHRRASAWHEAEGLHVEAFRHAAAAGDVALAQRLAAGGDMPLHFRGAAGVVRSWLESLPTAVLDERPALWITYASVLTFAGTDTEVVERKLQLAEAALGGMEASHETRDLTGRIASLRAMQGIPKNDVDVIVAQSLRALEFLDEANLPDRTAATWTLGLAYQLRGEHAAAIEPLSEAVALGESGGNVMATIAAATSLGQVREAENELHAAASMYGRVLALAGDPPLPAGCEAHLGLARVYYQWNDLAAARRHGEASLHLASQMPSVPTPAAALVVLATVKRAERDVEGAANDLVEAERFARANGFAHLEAEIARARVRVLLRRGDTGDAERLATAHALPLARVRALIADGDADAALALLEPLHQQAQARERKADLLEIAVLRAVGHDAAGDEREALRILSDALRLAEPGGFVRVFVDEGAAMSRLLSRVSADDVATAYVARLRAAFRSTPQRDEGSPSSAPPAGMELVEPLSEQELKVLRLVADGLSNRQIADRLFRSLSTIKGHNRNIFAKLHVRRRTEAVALARELGLL